MTVTRRSFLRSGAAAALVAGAALDSIPQAFAQSLRKHDPSRDFQIPFEVKQSPLFYFKRETFQPYVGGTFRIRAGANGVSATLVSVRDCTPSPNARKMMKKAARPSDCFALVFRADGALTDLTTIYDVEHAALGTFPLFLTQRGGPRGTVFYEAVFNHAL